MILGAFAIVLFVCAGLTLLLMRARMRRGMGAPKCGRCRHQLIAGQFKCPECGDTWCERDPGAAVVFPLAAGALERWRRTWLVQAWALGIVGVIASGTAVAFVLGVLPPYRPSNALWTAEYAIPLHEAKDSPSLSLTVEMEGWAQNESEWDGVHRLVELNRAAIWQTGSQRGLTNVEVSIVRQGRGAQIAIQGGPAPLTYQSVPIGDASQDFAWIVQRGVSEFATAAKVDVQPGQQSVCYEHLLKILAQRAPLEEHRKAIVQTTFFDGADMLRQRSNQQQVWTAAACAALLVPFVLVLWVRARWLNRRQRVWAWAPASTPAPAPGGAPRTAAP